MKILEQNRKSSQCKLFNIIKYNICMYVYELQYIITTTTKCIYLIDIDRV